jgi:hypothetical protein
MNQENKAVIEFCNPSELQEAQKMLMEIRFDCIVKMYDCGIRQTKGNFLSPPKQLPPQWFALKQNFTLEFIKDADEYTIGRTIKLLFADLEKHIQDYENKRHS